MRHENIGTEQFYIKGAEVSETLHNQGSKQKNHHY